MHHSLSLSQESDDNTYLPLQLFIDKANVPRLNKRSMYPVVLYILCFSRKVRRQLAVNVAFIPLVATLSISGNTLSDKVIKIARSEVIQQTLKLLLEPLTKQLN